MPETAKLVGAFIRWLLKGCKTKLRDEIEGNLDATWGGTYDFENYVIGLFTTIIIIGGVILLVWVEW